MGYAFQFRYALLTCLEKLTELKDFQVSFETLDDIVVESPDSLDLIQAKHHMNRRGNLSDASPDIWKSFRVWCEHEAAGLLPDDSHLYLVTTSVAPDRSIASYLSAEPSRRNESLALERLREVATTHGPGVNTAAFRAFLTLAASRQAAVLRRVLILDATPSVVELDQRLNSAIFHAVRPDWRAAFLERLEEWWYRRCLHSLFDPSSSRPILSEDLIWKEADLREHFTEDNLPVDEIPVDKLDPDAYENAVFVHQLRLIDLGMSRVMRAVRDYYRAFAQRSRWLRNQLLVPGELDDYAEKLIDAWELRFERMTDLLGEDATEQVKRQAAEELYAWAERETIPIRRDFSEGWMVRGSYHILANDRRVGWHPEFLALLEKIIGPREAAPL